MACCRYCAPPFLLFPSPPPYLRRITTTTAAATPNHVKTLTLTKASVQRKPLDYLHFQTSSLLGGGGNSGGPHNNNNNGDDDDEFGDGDDENNSGVSPSAIAALFALLCTLNLAAAAALAREQEPSSIREVRGGKTTVLVPDAGGEDVFVAGGRGRGVAGSGESVVEFIREVWVRLMLPEGFPHSVTGDYLDYSLWRAVQGVASQVSGVLATQALLYAVGLGKGAIPVAAAINWVLKDGIGYLSKIMLSKYGRHFDVHPKGWRLFADLLENAAFGMEILTPVFPHLFVPIGAVAGAGRSAAALIQAATRSCFFAGFAAQRNFAEVIAKGEAQGMVSKSIGIAIGIALANWIGSSTPLTLATFSVVTFIHMYCNLKSYQSIQLRTLNPYRASLVFSEYLLSGQSPPIKEVNNEEPLFPAVPMLNIKSTGSEDAALLSSEAKIAASDIEIRLKLGSKLSDIVSNKDDAIALFSLYMNEGYILTEHKGNFCVVLKETCSQHDMLRAVFQVNYLYWLEKNAGIETRSVYLDCQRGGRLQISLDYVEREFGHAKKEGESTGWVLDGLVARPLPNRIRPGYTTP